MFNNNQLTTQMAPMAPLAAPLAAREVQPIIEAYHENAGNPRYGFRHLLLSVTDVAARVKPLGVSDILWAEAINKLEGLEPGDRDKLWPEPVAGFKDLSNRLQLQDKAMAEDSQRLQATETNVKLLQRHFQTDTLPWVQRLRQKEQDLQCRLLKIMRIVEGLEGKGLHIALTRGEAQLQEQLRSINRQLQGSSVELLRRVDVLLAVSRMQAGVGGISGQWLSGAGKINDQSLVDMREVMRQQTDAISRIVGALKQGMRDLDIIAAEGGKNGKHAIR